MKFVVISDTHGQHADLKLPEADGIIHAGDVTSRGTINQVKDFLFWYRKLNYKYKIFIAGNHDFYFEKTPKEEVQNLIPNDIIYLNDSETIIEGVKFWGSPITPWFLDWAFNRQRGEEIKQYWNKIPNDVDVLITHGPVAGILDKTFRGDHVGCLDLKERVEVIQPKFHIAGHIHEAYGEQTVGKTHFINASVLNLRYQLVNEPFVIEV